MARSNEMYFVVSAFLAAILIAATNVSDEMTVHPIGRHIYWIIRIGLESAMFYGAYLFLSRWEKVTLSRFGIVFFAMLLSHVPFVLSVTAMDIILGMPELGMEDGLIDAAGNSRLVAFGMEVIYLLHNHIALCFLTSLCFLTDRFVPIIDDNKSVVGADSEDGRATNREMSDEKNDDHAHAHAQTKTFLSSIEPALQGEILHLEAQEHYVNIVTSQEKRMVLSRFSDLIRELPIDQGMQVHRSHWIAYSAIKETVFEGQSLKIITIYDEIVLVSRSFSRSFRRSLESYLETR